MTRKTIGTSRHAAVLFLLMLVAFILTASCVKQRPFLCACYGKMEGTSYDIDVKSRSEANARCGNMKSQYGWDSCYILMHE